MARQLDLEHYRQMLEKERERMLRQVRTTVGQEEEESPSEVTGELADYDDQPGDAGTDTYIRERDYTAHDNARATIDHIDAALGKMEKGNYGLCDLCGKEIPEPRLNAVPYATLCVKCQTDVEGP